MKGLQAKDRRSEMDRRAINVLKMSDDYYFPSIEMDVHMYENHIRFFDTNKGHMIIGEVTHEDEDGFKFISKDMHLEYGSLNF